MEDDAFARFMGVRTKAEKAADRKIYEATLREIVCSSMPDTSGPELLRRVVEGTWFVQRAGDGSLRSMDTKAGKYRLAIEEKAESSGKLRSKKNGKGGRLLPIHDEESELAPCRIEGRDLVRSLPAEAEGLLLHLKKGAPLELRDQFFTQFGSLADAYDLESILACPGAGQIEHLKNATWYISSPGKSLVRETSVEHGRTTPVFTHPDRNSMSDLHPIRGEELFRLLAEDDRIDGLHVNRGRYLANTPVSNLLLSPGFACQILEGQDTRPGAQPLEARSLEEAELWLELNRFPLRGLTWVEAPYADERLIRAHVPDSGPGGWRVYESAGTQDAVRGELWSPVFSIATGASMEGTSKILCAGLLAGRLNLGAIRGEKPEQYWKRGRNCIVGRWVDEAGQKESQTRASIARELLKLLPPGEDRIPRRCILTVKGAVLLREHPYGSTRRWIEATLRQAERYTRPWVWGG